MAYEHAPCFPQVTWYVLDISLAMAQDLNPRLGLVNKVTKLASLAKS